VRPISVKCLLVDDREENLLALAALLRQHDVELLLARTGAEALDYVAQHDIALALLDVQMPDMDGFTLAESIRDSEHGRAVPIIFVTGEARDYQRMFRGYESGAVDFLYKPLEVHTLLNKVDVFLQLYRQRQQLEEELRVRTETLRLNEMFAAVLSHDLRTPLGAIVTGAQLLHQSQADEFVKRIASTMLSSSHRMTRLIEDLLDLTRARLAGGIPVAKTRVDLAPVISRVVQEHLASHPDARIEQKIEGDAWGEWDADRLGQVAANLIGNAVRYGDPAEAIQVRIDGTSDREAAFSVKNLGAIPASLRPHLFDPFRGGEDSGKREGLGLGLYIAQQIVCAHRGRIDVEIERNRYTVFTVTVPRHADAGTPNQEANPAKAGFHA
jgi:two-component system, sensor histidine kinase and response regulator